MVAGASLHRARAFAPAHVTGFFSPRLEAPDPRARGSIGGGLVLDVGVRAEATWTPGAVPRLITLGLPARQLEISREVARRLLARRPGRLTITYEQDLPTGQGFGSSSAGALSTALAAGRAMGLPRSDAVQVAHLADLFGRGGLGGVAAILGGGMELRLRPGIPPWGWVLRRRFPGPVWVGSVGPPIRSPRVLRDPRLTTRFANGAELLLQVARDPTPEAFWAAAEGFTDAVELGPRPLRDLIRGLRRRGAHAAQAMFGSSFFAAPTGRAAPRRLHRWMEERSQVLGSVSVDPRGARLAGRQPGVR